MLYVYRSHLAASGAYIYLANVVCSKLCGVECSLMTPYLLVVCFDVVLSLFRIQAELLLSDWS